ncbi:Tetratricopeptide repeat-containing protein [Lentibacillus persicus]|uniref:Tetratricopeptide repeat-containing protein n=1 Tax=Lentibacillus persicus TaxID=640948 RepID=A0A1I1TJK7_9BACI|nr:tetratricopeptide repeat protein [Lentibacillus persicus]SFD58727.1 Tetratricopeptide repeat-containing protein [Lentibacillus persicus]
MSDHSEKVVLFPKWRKVLEEDSLNALKEKRYEEALEKLDQLLLFGEQNHEVNIGKLMCLMELNRFREAQDFCEALLLHKDEHYYHYVHIYLTVLFQTSQYELLMDQAERELETETVPEEMREQFKQLFEMSKKMRHDIRIEKTPKYMDDLFKAVKEENHTGQYTLIDQIRKNGMMPTEEIKSLLKDNRVHPVTKTAIFLWLKDNYISEEVAIHKLGISQTINPDHIPALKDHPTMQQLRWVISELEHENPTLYKMMDELLEHYLYVRYPMMPDAEDTSLIAEALTAIGKTYLDIHINDQSANSKVMQYMDEIKMCEALYATIIEV